MKLSNPRHIVIVAGEESGDRHAAEIVCQFKTEHPNVHFSGIGGYHLQSAGVDLISDLARFGVTGITEVIRHLHVIRRAFKAIQAHLILNKPDLLVLVDYPGFNLRLAKFAKKQGIRVLYYVSPQIWAWKANRIHTIRECVDRMAVIFPFEKKIYEKAGVPVTFVGHPLMKHMITPAPQEQSREMLGLPINQRLIAMLPGSRTHEIERHMPVFIETAKRLLRQYSDLHFVIPVAGTLDPEIMADYATQSNLPITLIQGKAVEVAACSDCIIVASGTASLECALLEKPMCIIYKTAPLSYIAACCLVKIQYVGLCNILENRMIVPELLQYDCNADELTPLVSQLLENSRLSKAIKKHLHHLKQSLSSEEADSTISDLVLHELNAHIAT